MSAESQVGGQEVFRQSDGQVGRPRDRETAGGPCGVQHRRMLRFVF